MPTAAEQLKQGLFLHLQMNRNFIDQKVYKQFAQQCLKEDDITTLNRKKIIKVIKFVFDFGSNEGMKDFYSKLEKNVEGFILQEKQSKSKNGSSKVVIKLQSLIELIIYCVNHGFQQQKDQVNLTFNEPPKLPLLLQPKLIESLKKDLPKIKKQQVKQQQQQPTIKKLQLKKPQITILNPQLEAKVDKIKLIVKPLQPIRAAPKVSTRLDAEKIPAKSQFRLERYEMPNLNVGPKYLQSTFITKPKVQNLIQGIQYQPLEESYLQSEQNKKYMRERLLKIYQHYCRQQQNNSHLTTFDKIKSQLQHMNLGKFLIFCSSTEIFKDCEKIDKNYLRGAFKKQANGNKTINFEGFERVIEQLDGKYIGQRKKKNSNSVQLEALTYHSRLRLNTNQGYKQVIKLVNFVFFTRDNQGKKDIKDIIGAKIKVANTTRELTRHSGKFDWDLYEHVSKGKTMQKKYAANRYDLLTQRRQKDKCLYKSSRAINIQQIQRQQWPKINWLQQEMKRQQQQSTQSINNSNLKNILHRRKDVVGELKKRVEQVSKLSMK